MPVFPGTLVPWVNLQFTDDLGDPVSNGSVRFNVAGQVTLKDTFSDADLSTENDNPVQLDAAGRPESGAIFLEPGGYDVYIFDEDDVLLRTVLGVEDVGATFLSTLGQTLADGEKDAPDNYVITDADNLVTLLPVSGGDYYLPAAADRGLPLVLLNKSTSVAATINPDGADTINGVAGVYTIPAGSSPVFSGVTLYPRAPSAWYAVGYWTS